MSIWPSVVELQPEPGSKPRPPPRNHTERTAFLKCQGPGQLSFPPGAPRAHPRHWASDTLTGMSRRHPQPERWLHAVHLFGVQHETARVEAATVWLTHRPKIITLPYLGPSPRAAPLRSKQGAHYQAAHWRPVHMAWGDLLVFHGWLGTISVLPLALLYCQPNEMLSALLDFLQHGSRCIQIIIGDLFN